MKIQIDIPERCGKCPCYTTAETKYGTTFHICKAFNRVLTIKVNGLGNVVKINRCPECVEQTKEDPE